MKDPDAKEQAIMMYTYWSVAFEVGQAVIALGLLQHVDSGRSQDFICQREVQTLDTSSIQVDK